ncbi:MAG TPA: BrnA antitoxin family protein [Steroidobacteraceae bacterium]|nr:BrnA antitoxin family protein [Steroidobacteraceae bacterium]
MRKIKPLTNAAGDVRKLTSADFKRMRPATEVLSKEFLDNWRKGGHIIKHVSDAEYEAIKKRGRLKSERPKMPVTMRLDADVVEFFRSTGAGWQTRISALLTAHAKRKTQSASKRAK